MRLKRYITELAMKKETELRVDVSNSGNYIVRIKLDPLSTEKYRFSAKRFNSDQRDYESFEWNYGSLPDKIIDSMEKNFKKNIYDLTFWEVFFKDNAGNIQQVKKGGSEALQLFAALTQVMKNFVLSKKPEVFFFTSTAGEQSRVKLYNTIAKRVKGYNNVKINYGNDIVYLFSKK